MLTPFLLEQKQVLETLTRPSDLMDYYRAKSEIVDIKGKYTSLRLNQPHGTRVLIAAANSEKIDFVDFGFEDKLKVDLKNLKLNWGRFVVSDQRERDNIVLLIFTGLSSKAIRSIELITRNEVEEDQDEAFVEGAKFSSFGEPLS